MQGRIAAVAAALVVAVLAGGAGEGGWLAFCSKCPAPAVFAQSGIGTAQAKAQARMTRQELADWCANWNPGEPSCLREQLQEYDLAKVYSASADCTRGRLTPVQEGAAGAAAYTYAGVWDNSDIGGGRSKWRDPAGQIVGRDNASGGLGLSQQWELLCPKGLVRASAPAPAAVAPSTQTAPAGAAFRVGQTVQAQYGRDWVSGRVTRVIQMRPGAPLEYEVHLDNGQRGILPPRMIRAR